MELKDFIKATVKDIMEAEYELSTELSDLGVLVYPSGGYPVAQSNYAGDMMYCDMKDGRRGIMQPIDFDLSVTESESVKSQGNLGVSVLKAGINSGSGTETRTRIRFTIVVAKVR